MKTNLDIALAVFTVFLGIIYVMVGIHVYADELLNIAINGLKSMDCIKFYAFVSHTAAIGVLVKYWKEKN